MKHEPKDRAASRGSEKKVANLTLLSPRRNEIKMVREEGRRTLGIIRRNVTLLAREMEESNKGGQGGRMVQYKETRVRSRTKKTHSSCQEQPLHPF